MALSSEHRRLFAEEVARSREALAFWKTHASENYSLTTEARPAVADHLAACESLLERILDLTAESVIDQRQLAYWRANALAELEG